MGLIAPVAADAPYIVINRELRAVIIHKARKIAIDAAPNLIALSGNRDRFSDDNVAALFNHNVDVEIVDLFRCERNDGPTYNQYCNKKTAHLHAGAPRSIVGTALSAVSISK